MLLPLLLVMVVHLRLALWLRGRHLDSDTANRLWMEPSASPSFWRQPPIAAILAPAEVASAGPKTGEPTAPRDLLRKIVQAAEEATGPVRTGASQAAELARELVSRLDQLDLEIRQRNQEFDSGDAERIDGRLRALGPEAESEDDERRQMRKLLVQQREVAAQWAGRIQERASARDQLLTWLGEVATEVRALATGGSPHRAEGAERLFAVCARARARLAGQWHGLESAQVREIASLPTVERSAGPVRSAGPDDRPEHRSGQK